MNSNRCPIFHFYSYGFRERFGLLYRFGKTTIRNRKRHKFDAASSTERLLIGQAKFIDLISFQKADYLADAGGLPTGDFVI